MPPSLTTPGNPKSRHDVRPSQISSRGREDAQSSTPARYLACRRAGPVGLEQATVRLVPLAMAARPISIMKCEALERAKISPAVCPSARQASPLSPSCWSRARSARHLGHGRETEAYVWLLPNPSIARAKSLTCFGCRFAGARCRSCRSLHVLVSWQCMCHLSPGLHVNLQSRP